MAIKPASPATPDAPASGVVFSIGAVSFALAFEDDYSIFRRTELFAEQSVEQAADEYGDWAAVGELYMMLAIFLFFLI
ncbi:hypothetical protein [Planomicrobium okeanokoites]|uniref:hypothetical protein n=1 Tax=Planomicrobium okeanokoites TaxID=244 RepID=UPI000A035FBB|nr:hypothetical protein [Planomicrobium okeanokoites]